MILPDWLVTVLAFATAIAVALFVHAFLYRQAVRFLPQGSLWTSIVARTAVPTRLALVILSMSIAVRAAPLTAQQLAVVQKIMLIGFIVLAAVVVRTILDIWVRVHLRRYRIDTADNLLARKHVTQMGILRRIADTLIVVVTLAVILMTFEGVRQYGVSLLASAGAAGIVVGLALQPLLKNLFAGIQLALTQPIRIDDAVIVEGEWGNIEEITSTYVVVRIWDRRRLIVPLSYFIEQPFQNWTREEARLIGAVMIYLDYSVPVDAIRAELNRIVKTSENWDHDLASVQVTDFRETVMEVRILVSAADAGRAFVLRCEVREALASFLQQNYPHALPRRRVDFEGGLEPLKNGSARTRREAEPTSRPNTN